MNLRVQLMVSIDVSVTSKPAELDDVRERADAILHAARQRGDFLTCMTGSHVALLGFGRAFTVDSWKRLVAERGVTSERQRELLERFVFDHSDLSAVFGAFVEAAVNAVDGAVLK